jgi:hypothetical protein
MDVGVLLLLAAQVLGAAAAGALQLAAGSCSGVRGSMPSHTCSIACVLPTICFDD